MANTAPKRRVPVTMTLDKEFLEKLDAVAKKCGMNRSQFIEAFLEVTLESETPYINFVVELKQIAKFIWPEKSKSKLKSA